MIEAHNALFGYDIISLCETGLTDETVANVPMLDGYTFVPANHPDNVSHGGVGIFYKNSLPLIVRHDLSFHESIVVELKFQRKKIFFTVIYRSPSFKQNSAEFQTFLSNFRSLNSNLKAENPFAIFFTGDFNAHSRSWWPNGDTNPEGSDIDDVFDSINLSQIIAEPTNFTPNCKPSCIDLIVTDQPHLVLNSGTRPSLDPKCHHQIIHCKVNFRIPPPPPCDRKNWHYHRANVEAIQKSLSDFPWEQYLYRNDDVNWQVQLFTDTVLNVMTNFIPNDIKKIIPRDPPWISKQLKSKLNKKNRLYENYKKHGYQPDDKIRLDRFREDCHNAIKEAKTNYSNLLGNKLNDSDTPQKSYWKIISRVMNKCRAPKVPPLLDDGKFVLDCKEKARLFNKHFAAQCTPLSNDSSLPIFEYLTPSKLDFINISDENILSIIRSINPKKSHGPDLISGHMLRIADASIVTPLRLIFTNILRTSTYPSLWKLANVTPIHKKK